MSGTLRSYAHAPTGETTTVWVTNCLTQTAQALGISMTVGAGRTELDPPFSAQTRLGSAVWETADDTKPCGTRVFELYFHKQSHECATLAP